MKSVSPTASVSPERAKHLERNRIAANKCRERKKREHKQIERRLSDEVEKKETLLAQLNCLREEVWDLKNIIFQHAECEDRQINTQLARMTQSVLGSQSVEMDMSVSPTSSTKTWSDESENVKIEGDPNDWTVLPPVANEVYDGLNESMFDNFIADNLYT